MSDQTRLALMRAAEQLFVDKGIGPTSLAEITVAAGQRNRSAAQYHFGDKAGLLDAVLERHSDSIQAGWLAMLDLIESRGDVSLRDLVEILVRPVVNKLDDADGGAHYIDICAQMVGNPTHSLWQASVRTAPGAMRLTGAMLARVTLPMPLAATRMYRVMGVLYYAIADYARTGGGVGTARELFTADLIDCIHSMISASVSPQTLALLESQ